MKIVRKRWVILATVSVLGLVWLPGCTTAPVTGRHELSLVSSSEEMQLGLSAFDQLKTNTPINHDPALNALVQRVGRQIAQVASKDLPNAQWEFVVFESKEANAFCLPGGKVGVYTGILPITQSDAGLATVLGHEVGHAVAHHGNERMSEAKAIELGGQIIGSAAGTYSSTLQQATLLAYGAGTKLGRELPHSRAQESEADHIGVVYMARAGYDPKEAVAFWQRFMAFNNQQGGSAGPAFLRTHPLDEVRIRQLQTWLPEAQAQIGKAPPP